MRGYYISEHQCNQKTQLRWRVEGGGASCRSEKHSRQKCVSVGTWVHWASDDEGWVVSISTCLFSFSCFKDFGFLQLIQETLTMSSSISDLRRVRGRREEKTSWPKDPQPQIHLVLRLGNQRKPFHSGWAALVNVASGDPWELCRLAVEPGTVGGRPADPHPSAQPSPKAHGRVRGGRTCDENSLRAHPVPPYFSLFFSPALLFPPLLSFVFLPGLFMILSPQSSFRFTLLEHTGSQVHK